MNTRTQELLKQLADRKIPCALRAPLPGYPKSRQDIFRELVAETVPRDLSDDLSEAREVGQFSSEQLEVLKALSEKDYRAIIADSEDKLVSGQLGMPGPVGLRRMWLGLDDAGDWLKETEYQSKKLKRTLKCSIWKAIYISHWFDRDEERTVELFSSLAPESYLDFFLKLQRNDPAQSSLFAEPMREHGSELPAELVSSPSRAMVSWAESQAGALLEMSREERADYDTSLVLGVLASGLGDGQLFSEKIGSLLNFSAPSWLGEAYGEMVARVPVACVEAAVQYELSGYRRLGGDPLAHQGDLFEVADGLYATEAISSKLVEIVLVSVADYLEARPKLAAAALGESGIGEWLLDQLEGEFSGLPNSRQTELLRLLDGEVSDPPIVRREKVSIDEHMLQQQSEVVLAQLSAVGEVVFGERDAAKVLARSRDAQLSWVRCAAVDEDENRLVDVWAGKSDGEEPFRFLFPPDGSELVSGVSSDRFELVGNGARKHQLVTELRINSRQGSTT